MALLNNLYIFVEEENTDDAVTTTNHPTESGMPLSDTIRKRPVAVNLTGKIVDHNSMNAETIIKKIKALQKSGSLIKYIGQCGTISNLQIKSFNASFNNKNFGGADFDLSLQEIRTAKTAYVKQQATTVQSTTQTPTVGDTVTFTGGNVYVSSDATTPASNRGTSTCKITKISNYAWSKHAYHLISTDGRCVYGWVDASKVKAITKKTATLVAAGTQQINANKTSVYHSVKKGDTLWTLVNKTYRSKNLSMTEIVKNNPACFVNNNPNKLIAGTRLKIS